VKGRVGGAAPSLGPEGSIVDPARPLANTKITRMTFRTTSGSVIALMCVHQTCPCAHCHPAYFVGRRPSVAGLPTTVPRCRQAASGGGGRARRIPGGTEWGRRMPSSRQEPRRTATDRERLVGKRGLRWVLRLPWLREGEAEAATRAMWATAAAARAGAEDAAGGQRRSTQDAAGARFLRFSPSNPQ
jgi:hypothetical protein